METRLPEGQGPATIYRMGREEGRRLEAYIDGHLPPRGSIADLAADAGISAAAIYHWFNGTHEPSLQALGALARALGLRRYELVAVWDGDETPLRAAQELLGDRGTVDRLQALIRETVRDELARQ